LWPLKGGGAQKSFDTLKRILNLIETIRKLSDWNLSCILHLLCFITSLNSLSRVLPGSYPCNLKWLLLLFPVWQEMLVHGVTTSCLLIGMFSPIMPLLSKSLALSSSPLEHCNVQSLNSLTCLKVSALCMNIFSWWDTWSLAHLLIPLGIHILSYMFPFLFFPFFWAHKLKHPPFIGI
jgi:hypothetical protein